MDSNDPFEKVSTSAAAGCYMGCFTGKDCGCDQPMCPVLASVSAKDENTLQECFSLWFPPCWPCCSGCNWLLPFPIPQSRTWVRYGDTNWFFEQNNSLYNMGLVKELVSARRHIHIQTPVLMRMPGQKYHTCCKC